MRHISMIWKGLVATIFVAALVVSSATMAFAEDTASSATPYSNVDSGYSFYFRSTGATQGTAWRSKDTYSSTYVRVDRQRGHLPLLFVDGAWNADGAGRRNCTNGGAARAAGPGKYEIHNGVREQGYRFACLTGYADRGWGYLQGAWSPDCAGRYVSLN